MKIYPDTKVYIFAPGNAQTGGPESLHQLASTLISLGVQTQMFYIPLKKFEFNPADPVHDAYKKYHVPYARSIEDDEKNILIVPEIFAYFLLGGKKIRRVLWWLSANNYMDFIAWTFNELSKDPLAESLADMLDAFKRYKTDLYAEHWFKSEYTRKFLELNKIPAEKLRYVETYASQAFLSRAAQIDLSSKKNFVAYNPKKGFEITKQLINLAPDIEWRAIEDMTPEQVQELLASAKVYIDFGEHPGKDRLPREAALSSCVVITGKKGAAANDIDYNIPAEFKFDERTCDPRAVIAKIHEVFENFEQALDKQKAFREKELDARKIFIAQVIDAFEIKNFPPPTVAFTQGFSDKTFLLSQKFFGREDCVASFIVDDEAASENFFDPLVWRDQNRNFLLGEEPLLEIITRDDAKFLYREGRIKKFALLEPTDAELDALKNFYGADDSDIMILDEKNEPAA